MAPPRSRTARQEKGKAVVRAIHLEQLEDAGTTRSKALADADAQLDRIARLLPNALVGGLSLAEIARVTGVSRPTLYELRARYSDNPSDLAFGVLQTIAARGPVTEAEINARLARPPKDVARVIADFQRQDAIDFEIDEVEEGPRPVYFLSDKGYDLLEHWTFEAEGGDGDAT
ncbi:MAG: hypothetical protein QOJ29_2017 [Thermoleophilaceae bacterium]|jgi:chromosome segregation and condensation protein ScpB|nr:hypothetical protein [Thermoleophilaceae bacterium]